MASRLICLFLLIDSLYTPRLIKMRFKQEAGQLYMMDTLVLHLATGSSTIYENCDCKESSLQQSIGLNHVKVITRLTGLFGLMRRRTGLSFCRRGFVGRWRSLHACSLHFVLSCVYTRSSWVEIVWGRRIEDHIWFEQQEE